jgi:hypothetical protein
MQPPSLPSPVPNKKGFINPIAVKIVSFSVLVICIIISAIACILAIWDFTKDDVLWRTVATCFVVSGGMMAFGVVNNLYGTTDK